VDVNFARKINFKITQVIDPFLQLLQQHLPPSIIDNGTEV